MADINNPCAAGCPAGEHCFPEHNVEGRFVGTQRLDGAAVVPCCQVQRNLVFLKTARDILAHAEQQGLLNPGAVNAINDLRQVVDTMPPPNPNTVSLFHGSTLVSWRFHLDQREGADILQLLEGVVLQTGYTVEMPMPDLRRQPLQRRLNPQNSNHSYGVLVHNLPYTALTLATNVRIHVAQAMEANQVVALVLRALNSANPGTARVIFQTGVPLASNLQRAHIRRITNAMRASAFSGRITLQFAGDFISPMEPNVPHGVQPVPYPGANNIGAELQAVTGFTVIVSIN